MGELSFPFNQADVKPKNMESRKKKKKANGFLFRLFRSLCGNARECSSAWGTEGEAKIKDIKIKFSGRRQRRGHGIGIAKLTTKIPEVIRSPNLLRCGTLKAEHVLCEKQHWFHRLTKKTFHANNMCGKTLGNLANCEE